MPRPDSSAIVGELRQTDSASKRQGAIRQFTKALRRGDRFQPTWDAVGGAAGLAQLMAEFSVKDVRTMCKALGRTASAEKARPERRKAFGELVEQLCNGNEDDRPLREFYQNIVPACTMDVVEEWENKRHVEWTSQQQKRLSLGHREQHEKKFLEDIFSRGKELTFLSQRRLFCGNMAFSEEILNTLLAKEGDIRVPNDFVDELVMPLLKRLLKRRFDHETRQKYLHLVVRCIQKHKKVISNQLNLFHVVGPVQYTINRWYEAPVDSDVKERFKDDLIQLIELSPANQRRDGIDSLRDVMAISKKLDNEARYDLLRLLFLHAKGYNKIDIDDGSDSGLGRLNKLTAEKGLWPAGLFLAVDSKKAMQLFERLDKAHPSSDFLSPGPDHSVIAQRQRPDISTFADVEVARVLFIRMSKTENEHEGWLERARTLVQERRVNSQQAREPGLRAFWAMSALNLCVAAADIETLGDTVLWARRFTKDTLACKELYGPKVFKTKEIAALLAAMPAERIKTPAAAMSFTSSVVKEDIVRANRILINLLETATKAVGEPGFQRRDWDNVIGLLRVVADKRFDNVKGFLKKLKKCTAAEFAKCETVMVETVWKPTMDTLIEAEAIVRNPTSDALRDSSYSSALIGRSRKFDASGLFAYKKLAYTAISPTQLAYLARFLLDQMRARLGSEAMRVHMGDIVSVIESIANSDQPALASPFIRDLVLHDEGAAESSAWHRQLLSVAFLSSLPAKAAKEILQNMGGAMTERLRQQNEIWDKKEETDQSKEADGEAKKPQTPWIKVTTVKMLAQILQNNLFINASSSCDILIGLLAEARHIDIRITITSSLISAMQEPTCPPELRSHILDALEKYIVPVVADLNERRSMRKEDWAAAEEDGAALPAVSEETPLLALLVEQANSVKLNEDDKRRLAQLIMTALEQSAVNNARWMKLFLAKNKFYLGEGEELPKIPVNITMLSSIFAQLMAYMPLSVFNMIRSVVFTNINPTPAIKTITKLIKKNRDLVNSKPGKHWLAQFNDQGVDAFKFGLWSSVLALQKPSHETQSKLEEGKGITIHTLEDFLLDAVELLLQKGEYDLIERIVLRLCEDRFRSRESWASWRENCYPLIERIILKTDEVRVRQRNEKSQGKTPVLLPNSTLMNIAILPVPFARGSPEEETEFISKLRRMTETFASRRRPYHNDFVRLKNDINNWPSRKEFVRFALKLAEETGYDVASDEEAGPADYMCFELAEYLLTKADNPKDKNIIVEARELLDRWANCGDEGVRELGIKSREQLKRQSKGGWFKRAVSEEA
ncbi:Hypothetical protein NCS54_00429000 [Fusarium falciforme]|uniref:Hypothetical protein n=1 Tax=Fusarium falciforme TaxID=195108 RepID=UPI0022FFF9CD|nr:Hypothetical protein NCS54_00429000 [Fusarium falciforme]WAO86996.1 Hypothetical protein NCS54_00429000 [Fusarium falciforme]